jgi:hypothetical protein
VPSLPDVANVVKLALEYALSAEDQNAVNRLFFKYSGTAPTDSDLDTFANAVGDAWGTALKSWFGIETTLDQVTAEDLTSPTAAVGNAPFGIEGTRTGGFVGAATCAVIRNKIARRYRGGHPRTYWQAGVDTDLDTANTWSSDFQTGFETAVAAFVSAVEAAGWTGAGTILPVNISYYEGFTNHTYPSGRVRAIPTLRVTPLVDSIIAYQCNPQTGSQRRRNGQKRNL